MDNEYEQIVSNQSEILTALREDNESLRNVISHMELEGRWKDGMIAGLKYAIRCNGISGGEIQ